MGTALPKAAKGSVDSWEDQRMWVSLILGHLQGAVCQEGPQNHQGPQPPQPHTVTAVGEMVPKPRAKTQRMTMFFRPSSQAPGETHYPQTNPTHTAKTDYFNIYFCTEFLHILKKIDYFNTYFCNLQKTFTMTTTTSAFYFSNLSCIVALVILYNKM